MSSFFLQSSHDYSSFCFDKNVTYQHRVDNPEQYNYCVVPERGYDAFLYAGIAIVLSCLIAGKLSAVLILLAGMAYQALVQFVNLGPLSNGAAIWLNMRPAEIFFYAFLPPLLLDSSIRIDFFVFKKVMWQVLIYAVLVVVVMTVILSPIVLYGFGLSGQGWDLTHAVLYCTMIASTDAVAVSAILKQGGGPEDLSILMEGESLFNDATSIVLFELFLQMVVDPAKSAMPGYQILGFICYRALYLGVGGAVFGLVMGYLTKQVFRLVQFKGDDGTQQVVFSLAGAYLSYYIANGPLFGEWYVSGVIAVVVYGLYGSYSLRYDLETTSENENVFDNFWTPLASIVNSLVFFFSGATVFNFFVRSIQSLEAENEQTGLAYVLWQIPIIYVVMFAARGISILFFSPILRALKQPLSLPGTVFVTWAGLRGAVALILMQTVVITHFGYNSRDEQRIKSSLALWTAGVTFLTLVINAPLIGPMLQVTGLDQVEVVKVRMRRRAKKALLEYTKVVLKDLKSDEDEIMRGVNWGYVSDIVDLSHDLRNFGALEHELSKSQQTEQQEGRKIGNWKLYNQTSQKSFRKAVAPNRIESLEPLLQQASGDASSHEGFGKIINHQEYQNLTGVDGDLPTLDSAESHQASLTRLSEGVEGILQQEGGGGGGDEDIEPQKGFIRAQQDGQVIGITGKLEKAASSILSPNTDNQENEPQVYNQLESYVSSSLTPNRVSTPSQQNLQVRRSRSRPARGQSVVNVLQRTITEFSRKTQQNFSHYEIPPEMDMETGGRNYWQSLITGEQRTRLVSGMQRFINAKRSEEGLISSSAVRVVDHCFQEQMESPGQPLDCWHVLQNEVTSKFYGRLISWLSFRFRNLAQKFQGCGWWCSCMSYIVREISRIFGRMLGRVMLLSMELAIEYYLALTHSPQSQIICSSDNEILKNEIEEERSRVWKFILTREIEAPARFQAIQNYRATLSVLRRQSKFIREQLFTSGMIDKTELDLMVAPIHERIRYFKYHGPQWVPPKLGDILRSIPFLTSTPYNIFNWIVAQGQLRQYAADEYIIPALKHNKEVWKNYQPSVNILVNGLAKLKVQTTDGLWQEQYLGAGATVGLVSTISGASYLKYGVRAMGNAIKRGPVIFKIPKKVIEEVEQKAGEGDEDHRFLQLNLYRLAAYYIVEHNKAGIMHLAVHQLIRNQMQAKEGGQSGWGKIRGVLQAISAFKPTTVAPRTRPNSFALANLAADQKEARFKRDLRVVENMFGDLKEEDFSELAKAAQSTRMLSFDRRSSLSRQDDLSASLPTTPLLEDIQAATTDVQTENIDTHQELKITAKNTAKAVFSDVKAGIVAADLFMLPAGEMLIQKSHIVLMRGCLIPMLLVETSGKKTYKEGGTDIICKAPCVMTWLGNDQESDEVHLKAGVQGAAIIVCPIYNEEGYDDEEQNEQGVEILHEEVQNEGGIAGPSLFHTHSTRTLEIPYGTMGYERAA